MALARGRLLRSFGAIPDALQRKARSGQDATESLARRVIVINDQNIGALPVPIVVRVATPECHEGSFRRHGVSARTNWLSSRSLRSETAQKAMPSRVQ